MYESTFCKGHGVSAKRIALPQQKQFIWISKEFLNNIRKIIVIVSSLIACGREIFFVSIAYSTNLLFLSSAFILPKNDGGHSTWLCYRKLYCAFQFVGKVRRTFRHSVWIIITACYYDYAFVKFVLFYACFCHMQMSTDMSNKSSGYISLIFGRLITVSPKNCALKTRSVFVII